MQMRNRKRKYHLANFVSKNGDMSALCFPSPRKINLKVASWTIQKSQVTCKKCLEIIAKRGNG